MEKPTGKNCLVCGGEVVEKIESEFDPRSGPMIIGPGSKHQHRDVSKGFHCMECGLKYEFSPPTGEEMSGRNRIDIDRKGS